MKINDVLQAKNFGKVFKINVSGEEFQVYGENGLLGLRRVGDYKEITDVLCLHLILLGDFEEVENDLDLEFNPNTNSLLSILDRFDLDYEDDGKRIKFEGDKFERMIHELFLK